MGEFNHWDICTDVECLVSQMKPPSLITALYMIVSEIKQPSSVQA